MLLKKLEVILVLKQIYQNSKFSKEIKMNKLMKLGLFIAIAAYVISPTDALPGPIDDILIMLLGMAANKKINKREENMKGKTVVEADGYHVY